MDGLQIMSLTCPVHVQILQKVVWNLFVMTDKKMIINMRRDIGA